MQGNINLNEKIADSGCAVTSCAVVVNYLQNKSITPATLNTSAYLDSSNWANWGKIGSAYYLSYAAPSTTEAITYLKRGYPVIVHKENHFFRCRWLRKRKRKLLGIRCWKNQLFNSNLE